MLRLIDFSFQNMNYLNNRFKKHLTVETTKFSFIDL